MEITWYGMSCFKLAERGSAVVITDPYDHLQPGSAPLKLAADIITISHETPGDSRLEEIKGTPYMVTGPGEYEVGGVFITGIQTGGQKGSEAAKEMAQSAAQNTLYVFDFNSLTVAHLGELDRILSQAEIEAIGTVNVALVPIGEGRSLSAARAAEVISQLEPKIVVPMHYAVSGRGASPDSLNKFLKEMGVSEVERRPSLKVTNLSIPEETKVIVLDLQRE